MTIQLITLWERYNKNKKRYEHNHFEDGWNSHEKPKPICEFQEKMWKSAKWKKTLLYLIKDESLKYPKVMK